MFTIQNMSNIRQEMTSLFLSSNMFLPCSLQLQLLLNQRLSLIIFFSIISLKKYYQVIQQKPSQITYNVSLHPIYFHLFQTEKPIYLNVTGQNLIIKHSSKTRQIYFSVVWPPAFNLLYNNIDRSFQNFFDPMNTILDKHGQFKRISRYKLKFKTRPQITTALQKSVSIKNKNFKHIRKKNLSQKN